MSEYVIEVMEVMEVMKPMKPMEQFPEYTSKNIQIKNQNTVGSPWLKADTMSRDYGVYRGLVLRLIEVADRLNMDYSYFIERYLEKSDVTHNADFENLYRMKLLRKDNESFEYESLR
ncbi:hypothetical protein [Endozoicomonas sp. ISHI1]|uniref:hypothetical protein n=1 Tax=Endozoicomonas sp. ISHI1 TaxID=2825882 RepID=UPI002148BC63|nr:hypothetical protein [Endozoicomonas sp. ISHI1]